MNKIITLILLAFVPVIANATCLEDLPTAASDNGYEYQYISQYLGPFWPILHGYNVRPIGTTTWEFTGYHSTQEYAACDAINIIES